MEKSEYAEWGWKEQHLLTLHCETWKVTRCLFSLVRGVLAGHHRKDSALSAPLRLHPHEALLAKPRKPSPCCKKQSRSQHSRTEKR